VYAFLNKPQKATGARDEPFRVRPEFGFTLVHTMKVQNSQAAEEDRDGRGEEVVFLTRPTFTSRVCRLWGHDPLRDGCVSRPSVSQALCRAVRRKRTFLLQASLYRPTFEMRTVQGLVENAKESRKHLTSNEPIFLGIHIAGRCVNGSPD